MENKHREREEKQEVEMGSPKKIIKLERYFTFFTDVKMDDICAIAIFLLHCFSFNWYVEINFVITDISKESHIKARGLLEVLVNDMRKRYNLERIICTYSFGTPPMKDGKPKIQRHEEDFLSYYPPSKSPKWIDPRYLKGKNYECFVFAPFTGFVDIIARASHVYTGIGYNTRKTIIEDQVGLTLKHFKALTMAGHHNPTSVYNLTIMNNCSPTIYPLVDGKRIEGGRFQTNDNDLWSSIHQISPILVEMKHFATIDSKKFVLDHAKQAFKDFGIETEITMNNLLSREIQEICKGIKTDKLESYLFRSIEQLARGVIDVELTDFQHMCLWLSETNIHNVSLKDSGKGYLDIVKDEHGVIRCPTGLSLGNMRATCIDLCKVYTKKNTN